MISEPLVLRLFSEQVSGVWHGVLVPRDTAQRTTCASWSAGDQTSIRGSVRSLRVLIGAGSDRLGSSHCSLEPLVQERTSGLSLMQREVQPGPFGKRGPLGSFA